MAKLLDVASVIDDSRWVSGLTVETLQCSLHRAYAALCLPAPAGYQNHEGAPAGMPLSPMATIVHMRRSNLCMTADGRNVVDSALEAEKDKSAGRALWYGTGDATMWLGASGVTELSGSASVGEALKAFYDGTVGVEPVIHMGLKTALETSGFNAEGRLKALPDIPVVVNPSYPDDALAITGPIQLYFSPPESIQVMDFQINREDTAAVMFTGVSFDACAAFVRGELPDQVYAGIDGMTVTAYVIDSGASATIGWGDDGSWTVTNKALTSNVATLTTSANHKISVGDSITVAGVDATFNGTFTVTAKTDNTVSYAKTAANVTSAASSGTITKAESTDTVSSGTTAGVTHTYEYSGDYSITVTTNSGTNTYDVTV